jgi:hypothetical protein
MSFLVMALRFEIWRHQTIPVVSRIVESKVKIDLEEVNTRRGAWAYGHARAVSAL